MANDLAAGSRQLTRTGAMAYTVEHRPRPSPDGCAGPYTLQLSKQSALVIWCDDPETGKPVSSHTTTYHLNYVAVPATFIVKKGAGEHTFISLAREGDRIVVTGVR